MKTTNNKYFRIEWQIHRGGKVACDQKVVATLQEVRTFVESLEDDHCRDLQNVQIFEVKEIKL